MATRLARERAAPGAVWRGDRQAPRCARTGVTGLGERCRPCNKASNGQTGSLVFLAVTPDPAYCALHGC